MSDHDCGPLDPCPVCEAEKDAYAQGRADERAAVVAWLRSIPWRPTRTPEELSAAIERGEHLPEEKKP